MGAVKIGNSLIFDILDVSTTPYPQRNTSKIGGINIHLAPGQIHV